MGGDIVDECQFFGVIVVVFGYGFVKFRVVEFGDMVDKVVKYVSKVFVYRVLEVFLSEFVVVVFWCMV